MDSGEVSSGLLVGHTVVGEDWFVGWSHSGG